jgi:hypothetical protein
MIKELPRLMYKGKEYYSDYILNQIRDVDNPNNYHNIKLIGKVKFWFGINEVEFDKDLVVDYDDQYAYIFKIVNE